MGMKMEVKQDLGIGLLYVVESVDAFGDMTVNAKFDKVKVKMENPVLGTIEYDSENPTEEVNPIAKLYSSLFGYEFNMIMAPDGEIKELKGINEMMDKVVKSIVGAESEEDKKLACYLDSFKEQFGEETMMQSFGQTNWLLPDEPVEKGGSWTKKIEIDEGFPMVMIYNCTLKEMKWSKALIDVSSVIKSNPDGESIVMGPIKMKMDLSGEQYGTVEVNRKTGLPIGGSLTQEFSGKMVLDKNPEDPCKDKFSEEESKKLDKLENMVIPIKMKMITTFGTY